MDWRETIVISGEYAEYKEGFTDMLTTFLSMWHGYASRASTLALKHRVNLEPPTILPIRLLSYRAGPELRDFVRSDVENILCMNVIDPA